MQAKQTLKAVKASSYNAPYDDGIDGEFLEESEKAEVFAINAQAIRKAEEAKRLDTEIEEIRRHQPDLIARAAALAKHPGAIRFPEYRKVGSGEGRFEKLMDVARNRFAAWRVIYGEQRPYFDSFKGRVVDAEGNFIDKLYPIEPQLDILAAAGMTGQEPMRVRADLRDWAMSLKRDSQIERMNRIVPVWDGVSRLETKLITLFECPDTPLNREFGKYFWLSLYCRVTQPGCLASMSLALIGGQNTGKSYFSKRICETLMDDRNAGPAQLSLAGKSLDFLRDVMGRTVIANISEMNGLRSADKGQVRSFMTLDSDTFDYKYEGAITKPRQWIFIMDGNKYEGVQADDTGNRRFYPMFVAQLPNEKGRKAWKTKGFKADFTNFNEDVLQIMAECRAWLAANGGMKGYVGFENDVSAKVADFNKQERDCGSGTIEDPNLEQYMMAIIRSCPKHFLIERTGARRFGVAILNTDFADRYRKVTGGERVNWNRAKDKVAMIIGDEKLRGEVKTLTGNKTGYFFAGFESEKEFNDYIDSLGSEEWEGSIPGEGQESF